MNEQTWHWDQVLAVWDELREMARYLLSREGRAQSVQPTELVLTALFRQKPGRWKVAFDQVEVTWENRKQFFGQMNQAMRQALCERGRRYKYKRQIRTVPIDGWDFEDLRSRATERPEVVELLAQALETLHKRHPEWATLMEYRFWEGRSLAEAADMLEISVTAAEKRYYRARVWLSKEIKRIARGDGLDP